MATLTIATIPFNDAVLNAGRDLNRKAGHHDVPRVRFDFISESEIAIKFDAFQERDPMMTVTFSSSEKDGNLIVEYTGHTAAEYDPDTRQFARNDFNGTLQGMHHGVAAQFLVNGFYAKAQDNLNMRRLRKVPVPAAA